MFGPVVRWPIPRRECRPLQACRAGVVVRRQTGSRRVGRTPRRTPATRRWRVLHPDAVWIVGVPADDPLAILGGRGELAQRNQVVVPVGEVFDVDAVALDRARVGPHQADESRLVDWDRDAGTGVEQCGVHLIGAVAPAGKVTVTELSVGRALVYAHPPFLERLTQLMDGEQTGEVDLATAICDAVADVTGQLLHPRGLDRAHEPLDVALVGG